MLAESFPTGTVTFLFTDVEDSTRLWELHPEGMQPALARHDAILRQAVEANQGYLVKTTGDGCHAAFKTAAGAIAAAVTAQQVLNASPWSELQPETVRVRMGIHTGEAESREGDYYGSAVNCAARLAAIGHGGQVLISAATAELARNRMPAETGLLDLGEHYMKGLIQPEHVYQLVHPALLASFPPLRSLDSHLSNLPIQITSFIGRVGEIEETTRLLSTARLVTFTGPGGTGKTRLAQRVAAEMLAEFAGGVWLVELASISNASQVLPALAGVFELRSAPGINLLDLVTDYLRGKRMLIILDNCEHLIDACAQLADHLLHACPNLHLLISSREALGISGEVSYRVPSLSLPPGEELTPEKLMRSEAAQLFIERATAANPHFSLTSANITAVARICQRLDGIPLALELAAARTKLFPVEQIAERLHDRFRLLTGGSRTALPRQQTLRAMIDWSYDLLSDEEKALLRQLSVFTGGWTFEAADAVCSGLDVLSLLEQLVNKSLVLMEENQGQARFAILETIRQYAQEKLVDAGEVHTLRDRHLDYFLKFAEQAEPGLRSSNTFDWIDRLTPDDENILSAREWGQEHRPEDALILVGNLIFYRITPDDYHPDAYQWLHDLLSKINFEPADPSISPRRIRARARGLITLALVQMGLGFPREAVVTSKEAILLERRLDNKFYLGFTLGFYAATALSTGEVIEAHTAAEEALALIREVGDPRWILITLMIMVLIESNMGNKVRKQQLMEEIRQYLEHIGLPLHLPTLLGFGIQARLEGHYQESQLSFSEGLRIAERLKSRLFVCSMESELAHLRRVQGDLRTAQEAYRTLIWKWKDLGQTAAIANQLECFGMIACQEGERERAVRLLAAAEAIREQIQAPMRAYEQAEYDAAVATLRDLMDVDAFKSAWAEGRGLGMERAINYAVTPSSGVGTPGGG